jgi:flagellar hook-basal body complex protein FliE
MSDISVNSVLAQIRALSAQAAARPQPGQALNVPQASTAGAGSAQPAAASSGFGSLLGDSLDRVNNAQSEAAKLQRSFELGDPNTDLSSVMVATSKAQVSFRGMVEVRNRLVAAYQDVMNMPI